jgi:ribosomal-protein-serine acetyltransferase
MNSTIVVPPAIVVDTSLALHQLETYHAESLFNLIDRNRPHLLPWFDWVATTSDSDDTLRFIVRTQQEAEENSGVHYGLWFKEQLVGVVGVHLWEPENQFAELYYWLGADYTGRGLTLLSCQELINWFFYETDTDVVQICCEPENWQSANVARRLGFDYVGQDEQIDSAQEIMDRIAQLPQLAGLADQVKNQIRSWGAHRDDNSPRKKIILDMFQLTYETWHQTWRHIPSPG